MSINYSIGKWRTRTSVTALNLSDSIDRNVLLIETGLGNSQQKSKGEITIHDELTSR